MITANVTPGSNDCYHLMFSAPETLKKEDRHIVVHGLSEAYRVLYFRNRNYISEKLISWLKQRNMALSFCRDKITAESKISELQPMLSTLLCYRQTSFGWICDYVAKHHEDFANLAPKATSHHFSHYEKVISPILKFCIKISSEK